MSWLPQEPVVVLMCTWASQMLDSIANKNSSWLAVLMWPWLFSSGVCRREFVAEICAFNSNIPHNARQPFGNRVGTFSCSAVRAKSSTQFFFPSIESTFRLFNFKMYRMHYRLLLALKNCPPFCHLGEIVQTSNLQSSLCFIALRACRVQITHTSTVLLVGSLRGTKLKRSLSHQHYQSTVPAI